MRISDWSSDVCSSDLPLNGRVGARLPHYSGARARNAVLAAAQKPLSIVGRFSDTETAAAPARSPTSQVIILHGRWGGGAGRCRIHVSGINSKDRKSVV